jgi:O-antigen/teichoic acid export membrane protein
MSEPGRVLEEPSVERAPLELEESGERPLGDESFKKMQSREIAIAVRNGLKLGASLVLTWAVALIVKLQIPAHLGPVLQGRFAFADSFANMFFTVITLGVDTYIVKEVSVRPEHASDFLGGIFALRGLMSVVLFGIMAVTLRLTGHTGEIQAAVFVFGLMQLVTYMNWTYGTILQASTHVGRLAVANVLAKVAWGVGLLVALHYGAPLYVLALSMLASELIRTVFLAPAVSLQARVRYRVDIQAVRAVLLACLPFYVGYMAASFGTPLAMSTLEFIRKDEREVGWFAAAQNIASLAMLLHPLLVWVVMPMLSRVQARSEQEMLALLRKIIEALLIVVVPAATIIIAGADLLLHVAFGDRYAPAMSGLCILSLVFVMYYLSIILCNALVISGKSWSVTMVSSTAVLLMPLFMLVFVPIGRRLVGTGGECAGAGMAIVANEALVVVMLLTRFPASPFNPRNVGVLLKSATVATIVLLTNHWLLHLGFARLAIDVALYACLALVSGLVRVADVRRAIIALRASREAPAL